MKLSIIVDEEHYFNFFCFYGRTKTLKKKNSKNSISERQRNQKKGHSTLMTLKRDGKGRKNGKIIVI
jgi:hypothetical protein